MNGTDGNQFHPIVQTNEELSVYVDILGKNGYFTYVNSDTSGYRGLEKMKWQIKADSMYNQTANPENTIFFTEINGTSNMSTVLNAPVIASKGHYYQIASGLNEAGVTAVIVDNNNNTITPVPDLDDTYLGIE